MAVVIPDELLDRSARLLEAVPDEHLVGLAQTGHETAFATIVRRYEPELLAQARRLGSDGRAEDAVQQAFLNAFATLQAGGEVRHLRGWLHQILRNVVVRARVPADSPLETISAHGESLEETVQRRAQARATLVELSTLPDRQRDAILGTAVWGFPRAQVAQRMGLSEGAVRQLVHRARLRLRQAATALVPLPVGRFFGAARSAGATAGSDAAIGAGTAASGGLAIKVGTLVASGVVATGLAVTHSFPSHHHRTGAPPGAGAAVRHEAAGAHSARRLIEAPAIGAGTSSAISATSAGLIVAHRGVGGRHDGASAGGRAGPRATPPGRGGPPGPGRTRGDGRGHDPGARGEQGSGVSGRGQDSGRDGGARGSKGDDGGHSGSGPVAGGAQPRSGSGATASDGGGSGGTGTATETGADVSGGGSGGTDGAAGTHGSSGGSGSGTRSGSGTTSGSGTASGSDGGQNDSGASRDVSGSHDSSSS
jgi:RNA polymerase sigma factor (sigma-70 family)